MWWILWTWLSGIAISLFLSVLIGLSKKYFTLANRIAQDIQKGFKETMKEAFGILLLFCIFWPLTLVGFSIGGFGHLCLVGLKRLLYRFTEEGQEDKQVANHK